MSSNEKDLTAEQAVEALEAAWQRADAAMDEAEARLRSVREQITALAALSDAQPEARGDDLTAEQVLAEHLRDDPEIRCVTASEGDAYLAAARRVLRFLDRVRPSDAQPEAWAVYVGGLIGHLSSSEATAREHEREHLAYGADVRVVPLYAHPPTVQPTVDREALAAAYRMGYGDHSDGRPLNPDSTDALASPSPQVEGVWEYGVACRANPTFEVRRLPAVGSCCHIVRRRGDSDWWRPLDLAPSAPTEAVEALAEERLAEIEARHQPLAIWDECDCSGEEKDDGRHAEVEEVGLTCKRLYVICEGCCTENDYQREDCAFSHEHTLAPETRCDVPALLAEVKRLRAALSGEGER